MDQIKGKDHQYACCVGKKIACPLL